MTANLSIVIPAFNEARRITVTIAELRKFFSPSIINSSIDGDLQSPQQDLLEVIVVSDGSTDDTALLVDNYMQSFPEFPLRLIELCQNFGKGYAIKTGIEIAQGEYILFMDADLSTPIKELVKLRRSLELGYGVAIGSRGLLDSQITKHQAIYRELMGKMFNYLVRQLVVEGFYDTQCGFKLFRADLAKQIFSLLHTYRFGFDVEVLFIAQELGIRVIEVPVSWHNSPYSTVSPLKDAGEMFYGLLGMKHRVKQNLLSKDRTGKDYGS